jgi:hypothetical protein
MKTSKEKIKIYEDYPPGIILVSNLLNILIYAIGAFILYQIGFIWLVLYVIYALILEFRLISSHCTNCYYYGKYCAFGKGKIGSMFFKKGDLDRFCKMRLTWKSLIPDMLVSLIPIVVGITLLIIDFSWSILLFVMLLILLTSFGNGFVRRNLACRYCKQKKLGCPAEKLFNKNKK